MAEADDGPRNRYDGALIKRKQESLSFCILCENSCPEGDNIDNMTPARWNSVKEKATKWKGLDKFGNVCDTVDWSKGPTGKHMHNSCHVTLSSGSKLLQSQNRLSKSKQCTNIVSDSDSDSVPQAPKKLRSSIGCLHNKERCIWCMKEANPKQKDRDKELLLLSTKDSWRKFKLHTIHLDDVTMRERLNTLIDSIPDAETAFGIEIRYHRGCWRKYLSDHKNITDESAQHLQHVNLREAHSIFFNHVHQIIFKEYEFRTVQSLLNDYKRIISNFGHNSIVKSSYLKELLIKEFGESIGFHKRNQKNQSELVYDTTAGGTYVEAAIYSLGVSNDQLAMNVATRLKEQVMSINTIQWPPYIHELEREDELSELLLKLITWMKHPKMTNIDDCPTVRSIASVITSYITGKHTAFETNMSVMLHGLTKSREIIDVMHKDGLGISYNEVLMLRDFWVTTDLKHSLNCPFELAEGKPAVAIVDNDDFKSDTLTGADQPHRTNVMFVQPESFGFDQLERHETRPFPSSKLASSLSASLKALGSEMQKIDPYKTIKRGEPPIRTENENNSILLDTSIQRTRGVIHALVRAQESLSRPKAEEQQVPGYKGFHANMSQPQEKSRAIYYMTYSDPPSKTILYDVMCKLAKSINEKRMPFAIIVGDYPVYLLLLELKSEKEVQFRNILPFMAPFHIQMSFIYAIYKRFKGSGISDVLVAAGVIADGSVDQALRGKHFKRGVRCLYLFYETLVHHALGNRLQDTVLSDEVKTYISKLRQQVDAKDEELAEAYLKLESNAELKHLVDTLFEEYLDAPQAQYWISFMEVVEVLTLNIHALRTKNWNEFKSSLKLMLPWMVAYDNTKYGRHLPDFCAVLDNLPGEQDYFMESGYFAQSMTGKPYSSLALDIWIESTMNKGSKLKSGWMAILNNEKQLLSNTRNVNNINRVRASVHHHANWKKHQRLTHADASSSQTKKDEQAVQDISACFLEFDCDPFDPTNQTLRSLQSGVQASEKLAEDFKSARKDGEHKVNDFMKERVYSKQKSLYERIPLNKHQNFTNQELKTVNEENFKEKTGEMESKALASILGLVENSGALKLETVLQHRITSECLSIFNVNGTMRKVQKSKLQEILSMIPVPEPKVYTSIVDMGLIWHLATPTIEDREKGDGTKYRWGDYADKVVHTVLTRHKQAERIICINDKYDQNSIKDSERILRQNAKPVSNVFMKSDEKFPTKKDFHSLLHNPSNKIRLQAFLQTAFQNAATSTNVEIIYSVVGSIPKNLTTGNFMPELTCYHAEADTAIFTTYSMIRSEDYTEAVVIDTEDTDNYVQAAYVAKNTPGLMFIKRKHLLISAGCLCDDKMAECLIPIHVLTGCDHNSGFYGVGKKSIIRRTQQSEEAHNLLLNCGRELPVTQNVLDDMEQFVIRYVYCDSKSESLGEVRACKWRAQKKKSTIRLAPDSDSLRHHLERANYLTYLQKHFDIQSHPSPIGHGWHCDAGLYLPDRYTQQALPSTITLPVISADDNDSDLSSDADGSSDESSCDNSLSD